MRKTLFGIVLAIAWVAGPATTPAQAMALPAPAALNHAADAISVSEKVYYGYGYRPWRAYYRPYYSYYRPYYRPYYNNSYYRPYYPSYGYRPYYRPYYSYNRPYYRPAFYGPRYYGGYGYRPYGGWRGGYGGWRGYAGFYRARWY